MNTFMRLLKNVLLVATLAVMLVMPMMVSAQFDDPAASDDITGIGAVGTDLALGDRDIRETVGSIINVALGFLGVVAIVIVLIGGFKYMTAGGSDEKVVEARKWIISGIIGLAIILSAYAVTSFVINRLVSATA